MAVTFKVAYQWEDTKTVNVVGTLIFSGNYVVGGDTVNFGTISVDTFGVSIKSNVAPLWLDIQANIASFQFIGLPSGPPYTPPPTAKVQIFNATTGLELAAGAYPAAITSALVQFSLLSQKHLS